MANSKTYIKNPFVLSTELDNSAVLLNLETGCQYKLNQTGLRIWQLVNELSNPKDIAQKLANEFKNVSSEKTLASVLRLFEELEKEEMLLSYREKSEDTQHHITLVLTGDSIITQRLSVYDENDFVSILEILRGSDVAFTNLEVLIHDYEGYPAAESHGSYMAAEPFVVKELKWAGLNLVSRSNNHAMDYGIEGLRTTTKILGDVGFIHAGVGENLALSRTPAYLETKHGRVALISCSSTFPPFSKAGEQRSDIKGRPGLNPLRYDTTYIIDRQSMDEIKRISSKLKLNSSRQEEPFKFFGNKFMTGDPPRIITTPNRLDLSANVESIQEAKEQADLVLVSHHAHEGNVDIETPAEFVVTFARACIDAGADVYIGHGPHVLRGIEIYKGRPIFYSLGNFIFQSDTIRFSPAEWYEGYGLDYDSPRADLRYARREKDKRSTGFSTNPIYWVSVMAQLTFGNGMLTEINLYPISLGFGKPSHQLGRPVITKNALGQRIINRIKQLSLPFGTKIFNEDGVGIVEVKSYQQRRRIGYRKRKIR